VHLGGFIIGIYHDARSPERQIYHDARSPERRMTSDITTQVVIAQEQLQEKVKVKFALEEATKARRGSIGIAVLLV